MADIRPFRGIHFNHVLLQDWTRVICPVYDIIPPQQQEELYTYSPYNFVRLEAGRDLPQDTPSDNKYTRSATIAKEWLEQGILVTDKNEAIYLHDHYFTYGNKQHKRRNLIARVRLEEWDTKIIRPHESTLSEPKTDRLSLLYAIQANTSSILSMYQDEKGELAALLDARTQTPPFINLPVTGGEGHRVWALTESETISAIREHLLERRLYIADGHHRYESALNYRRQKRTTLSTSSEEPYDFVMMTLIEFNDPGLMILPPHRLVRGIPKSVFDGLRNQLELFFKIEEWPLNAPGAREKLDILLEEEKDGRLVLFGLTKNHVSILNLIDRSTVTPMMPYFCSDLYKKLEVSLIDHVVLDKLMALSHEKDKANLGYCYDHQDAINHVLSGEYQLTFLLTSIKAEVIKAIADVGDKMPKKSTYFYPKVPAGLIVNRLV